MYAYEVGKPYIPGTTCYQEGVNYNYRQGAHELRLFFGRLTSKERTAIRTGAAEFALAVHGPVIFLLYRSGEAISWSDAP